MEKNKEFNDIDYLEKLATEFCKHEVLMDFMPKTSKKSAIQFAIFKAYEDIAENLGLSDIELVMREIQNLKKYADSKMRRYVRLSVINGGGGQNALNCAPEWLRRLDKPFNLLQRARRVETLNSFKYYRVGRRVNYFLWELLQSARCAAARELCNSPAEASLALTSKDAVREYAETVDINLDKLHGIWVRFYAQSIDKLMALVEVGDRPDRLSSCERLSLQDWRAVDIGLLYDIRLRVVSEENFKSSLAMYPLILLFKLMVVAKNEIDQKHAENSKSNESHIGRQNDKSSAHTENEQSSRFRNSIETVTPSCSNITANMPEIYQDNALPTSKTDKKGPNEYETAELWALVHSNYRNRGLSASAVLLQKRWHELKQKTRTVMSGPTPEPGQLAPEPILLALGKRCPYILTEEMPSWSELVKNNQVFHDQDLKSYKIEHLEKNLDVPNKLNEDILFDELNDWSDEEVEVIENKETITISDSDDEQTVINPNKNTDNDKSIKQLKCIDSTKVNNTIEENLDSDINNSEILNSHFKSSNISKNFNNDNEKETRKESELNNSDNDKSDIGEEEIEHLVVNSQVERTKRCQFEVENLIQNINDEIKDELNELSNTLTSTDPNDLCNDGPYKVHVKIETVEHFNDESIKLEADIENNDIRDINKSNNDITDSFERCQRGLNNDRDSYNYYNEVLDIEVKIEDNCDLNEEVVPNATLIDEKLIKLSRVVLTPIEDLYEWQNYSKDGVIDCSRIDVGNFTKKIVITTKELIECRQYLPLKNLSRNGISAKKNFELDQTSKSLKQKRKFLTTRLKLPRTYFSLDFWNERNIELLELCKPVSIKLNGCTRVVKKVELTDNDEVRRMNKTILTAQVVPITAGANRKIAVAPIQYNKSNNSGGYLRMLLEKKPVAKDASNSRADNLPNVGRTTPNFTSRNKNESLHGTKLSIVDPKNILLETDQVKGRIVEKFKDNENNCYIDNAEEMNDGLLNPVEYIHDNNEVSCIGTDYEPEDRDYSFSDNLKSNDLTIYEEHTNNEFLEDGHGHNGKNPNKMAYRRNSCIFCNQLVTNFSRHLKRNHKDEKEVIKYLAINDPDPKIRMLKRRKFSNKLRNRGNFEHNTTVALENKDVLLPRKRSDSMPLNVSEFVNCRNCLGTYKRSLFSKHFKKCGKNISEERKNLSIAEKNYINTHNTLPLILNDATEASNQLKEKVLSKLRPDNISFIIHKDPLILTYGSKVLEKRKGSFRETASSGMRDLATILKIIREKDNKIKKLKDIFVPNKFELLTQAIKNMAGFNEETGCFKTVSIIHRVRAAILACVDILYTQTIVHDHSTEHKEMYKKKLDDFKNLLQGDFFSERCEISSNPLKMKYVDTSGKELLLLNQLETTENQLYTRLKDNNKSIQILPLSIKTIETVTTKTLKGKQGTAEYGNEESVEETFLSGAERPIKEKYLISLNETPGVERNYELMSIDAIDRNTKAKRAKEVETITTMSNKDKIVEETESENTLKDNNICESYSFTENRSKQKANLKSDIMNEHQFNSTPLDKPFCSTDTTNIKLEFYEEEEEIIEDDDEENCYNDSLLTSGESIHDNNEVSDFALPYDSEPGDKDDLLNDETNLNKKIYCPESIIENSIDEDNTDSEDSEDNDKKNRKNRKRRIYRRNACVFCDCLVTNFSRHIIRNHAKESEVQQYMKINDRNPAIRREKRRKFTDELRNRGNFKYNSTVALENKGVVLPRKRLTQSLPLNLWDFASCKNCFGTYKRSLFYKHVKKCGQNVSEKNNLSVSNKNRIVRNKATSIIPNISTEASKELREKVLSRLRCDEISFIIQTDPLILAYGSKILKEKNLRLIINIVCRGMRDLATLLKILREQDKEIKRLKDVFDPNKYDILVQAIKTMSGFNERTGFIKLFSVSTRVRRAISVCINILYTQTIENDSSTAYKEVYKKKLDDLKYLFQTDWQWYITSKPEKTNNSPNISKNKDETTKNLLHNDIKNCAFGNTDGNKNYFVENKKQFKRAYSNSKEAEEDIENKNKIRRTRWSEEEIKVVKKHFKDNLERKINPGKAKCEAVLKKEPILRNRTWCQLNSFINNNYKNDNKKMYTDEDESTENSHRLYISDHEVQCVNSELNDDNNSNNTTPNSKIIKTSNNLASAKDARNCYKNKEFIEKTMSLSQTESPIKEMVLDYSKTRDNEDRISLETTQWVQKEINDKGNEDSLNINVNANREKIMETATSNKTKENSVEELVSNTLEVKEKYVSKDNENRSKRTENLINTIEKESLNGTNLSLVEPLLLKTTNREIAKEKAGVKEIKSDDKNCYIDNAKNVNEASNSIESKYDNNEVSDADASNDSDYEPEESNDSLSDEINDLSRKF